MTHHASHDMHRIIPKPHGRGVAHLAVAHERRHKSTEGRSGYIGLGATITQATVQTSGDPVNYYPGVVYDSNGLRAYNAAGTVTMQINSADGSITVTGSTGVITGATIQTSAGAPRVVMDSAGIRGYNASAVQEFNLDASTGLLTATGIITNQPGSSVPWQTTGFFVGGGNLLNNSSADDPTSTTQTLYLSTGAGVTAGTFILQYAGATLTATINWNATASAVQTALNATGVLPTGVSATCSGGPLPATPITITLLGFATVAPQVITVQTSSLTGGTAIVGPVPTGWTPGASNAMDFVQRNGPVLEGIVFRISSLVAAGTSTINQTLGPFSWTPGTTKYTLSAYFQANTLAKTAQLQMTWLDSSHNTVGVSSIQSTWQTDLVNWQRLVLTATVPVAATRQQIQITGTATGGSFTLSYNGQTTAAILWNATAAQVLSAVQALSNVGASGAAFATGGPLPGTPVAISFVSPPAAAPAAMTFTSSLTGTSPGIAISNLLSSYLTVSPGVVSMARGGIHYIDAVQLEVGDAPTAFAPRPDEIVANTVVANMINVTQLSAISANLGTITAGTVTGATIQTSSIDPRVELTPSGFFITDSGGNQLVGLDSTNGLRMTGGTGPVNTLNWFNTNIAGARVGEMIVIQDSTTHNYWHFELQRPGSGATQNNWMRLSVDTVNDSGNTFTIAVANAGNTVGQTVVPIRGDGRSDFMMANSGPSNPKFSRVGSIGSVTWPGGVTTISVTVTGPSGAGTMAGVATASILSDGSGPVIVVTATGSGQVTFQLTPRDAHQPASGQGCALYYVIWEL